MPLYYCLLIVLFIFQASKGKTLKKQKGPQLPYVIPQKPLLPITKKDNKEEAKEEDNNIKEVSANKFPSSSSYYLNAFKRAINTINSNIYKDIIPNTYISYVLQGKLYTCAKGVSSKQAPTFYTKCKSYSNKSVLYYKVSFILLNILFNPTNFLLYLPRSTQPKVATTINIIKLYPLNNTTPIYKTILNLVCQ